MSKPTAGASDERAIGSGSGGRTRTPDTMISCACGAQWFGKYAVENPIIADHQGGRDGCRLVEHEEFLALGHRCKCGLCADGRRAARVGKRKAGTRAETTEPWNTETLADLQERRAAKFFLLISEESA